MSLQAIPIQNIYFLLAYAWNEFREGEQVDVDQTDCPDVHNLLAMVLSSGIRKLATRGMDKGYIVVTEETPRLRGRMRLLPSYQKLTQLSGRMICEFDELTADTLPNQILKATCQRLLQKASPLTNENRGSVHHARELLGDISPIQISGRTFHKVQLHRNNRHYRMLLHVCQLLHELYLPEERSGSRRFRNILEEETIMHRVFEAFVRNFAIRHCRDASVSAMKIKWDGIYSDEVRAVLPGMMTDVTLDRAERKTILDCKFYRDALVKGRSRDHLHSAHLYQLSAYIQNKSRDAGWENVEGALLYPAIEHQRSLKFELLGHQIAIYSIDLDQPWRTIHNRLLEVLG